MSKRTLGKNYDEELLAAAKRARAGKKRQAVALVKEADLMDLDRNVRVGAVLVVKRMLQDPKFVEQCAAEGRKFFEGGEEPAVEPFRKPKRSREVEGSGDGGSQDGEGHQPHHEAA